MHVDLGLDGLVILLAVSAGFGLAAQLMLSRVTTRWIGIIGGLAWLAGGFLASEVMFGSASGGDIAIVGGLAFHQSLVGGFVVGMSAILVTWVGTDRRHRFQGPMSR